VPLLDAAHIIADADPRGIASVSNGLSLCKIHHSAFDVNILGVDQDYIVHVREDVLAETDGPMLLHGLQEMQGQKLTVPRTQRLKPDRDRLAERFERFVAA
jgi:putative restriction endonuclease